MPSGNDVKLVNLLDLKEAYDNSKHIQTAVSSPSASGTAVAFIDSISQNTNGVISPTKKTVAEATQSAAGLMSALDKTKLDGIASGAQVNSVTGVKGNVESTYRTDNVNLTPANIGAVDKSGDTITGDLRVIGGFDAIMASLTADANPALFYKNSDNISNIAAIYGITSSQRLLFREFVPDTSYYEDYYLPTPTGAGGYQILTTKNPAQTRISLGIVAGNYVSVFNNGKATVPVSQWQLSNKPSVLILTLIADASESSDPTLYRHDAFLSYDLDNSTSENIVVCGYRANGSPLNGYMSYSYLAIP